MVKRKSTIRQSPKLPAEVRRSQILNAAEALFEKKGYRSTTVDEIAKKARLTKGAVYHHFKGKEDILFEMVKYVARRFYDGLQALPSDGLSPVDFLKALQAIESDPEMPQIRYNLDFRSQVVRIPRVRNHVRRMLEKGIELFSERIDPQFARSKKDRRNLAVFIYCLYDGLALRKKTDPGLVDMAAQSRLFKNLIDPRNKGN